MTGAFIWAMVAIMAASSAGTIYRVGKAEKPLTPRGAAAAVAARMGLIAWGLAVVLT